MQKEPNNLVQLPSTFINLQFGEQLRPQEQLKKDESLFSQINTPSNLRTLKPPTTPLPEGIVIKKMTPLLKNRAHNNLISSDINA